MRTTKARRALLISSVAGVTALAMASSAFACTVYKGKVTLTASGGTAIVEGDNGVHAYCGFANGAMPPRQNIAIVGTFRLDVAPGTACPTATNKLEAGAYDVQWLNLKPNEVTVKAPNNCNAKGVPMGFIKVEADGKGGDIFVIPQVGGVPANLGYVNICIEAGGLSTDPNRPGAPELLLNLI